MSDHQPPCIAVSVDVAVFTVRGNQEMIVLIERGADPYRGAWALPGGFVEVDEDLPVAASRELAEETGLEIAPDDLIQVRTYGDPLRDPRMRVVSVLFRVFVDDLIDPVGASDAAAARLTPVNEVLIGGVELAFDHREVIQDAVEAARL